MALFVFTTVTRLARHAEAVARARRRIRGATDTATVVERSAVNSTFAAAMAIALAVYSGLFSKRLPGSMAYPAGAVAFMDRQGLKGNLLCDFNWGEYLIWHTASRFKVFIDGRYDTVYPSSVIRDYLAFDFDQPGGSRVLDKYPHGLVLVPVGSGAFRVTSRSPTWTLVYRDPVAALFARAGSPVARLAGIPATGAAMANLFP
jgi:hypothetical protein